MNPSPRQGRTTEPHADASRDTWPPEDIDQEDSLRDDSSAPQAVPPDGRDGTDPSTAVVPITTLQHYLAEVRRYPFLSKEEELQLFHEYQVQGNREAAVKLILANLRV